MISTTQPAKDVVNITRGVREAVARALLEHKRAGRSIAVWREGRIVDLSPEEIPVEEEKKR